MKRRSFVTLIAIICAMLALLNVLRTRYYLKTSIDKSVNVLWNNETAFIFIGERTTGASGSYLSLMLNALLSIWGQGDEKEMDGMRVVQIEGKSIKSFEMKDLAFSGTAYPFKGSIYYQVGTIAGDWPAIWKWNGSNFVRLDQAAATAISGSFKFTSDQIAKEGWKAVELFLAQTPVVRNVRIDGISYNLTLEGKTANGSTERSVRLQEQGDNSTGTVLATANDIYTSVDRHTYFYYTARFKAGADK